MKRKTAKNLTFALYASALTLAAVAYHNVGAVDPSLRPALAKLSQDMPSDKELFGSMSEKDMADLQKMLATMPEESQFVLSKPFDKPPPETPATRRIRATIEQACVEPIEDPVAPYVLSPSQLRAVECVAANLGKQGGHWSAAQYEIYFKTALMIEGSGKRNPHGSIADIKGPMQIDVKAASAFHADPAKHFYADPRRFCDSLLMAGLIVNQTIDAISKALPEGAKADITPGLAYGGHQQGRTGLIALLQNPQRTAFDALKPVYLASAINKYRQKLEKAHHNSREIAELVKQQTPRLEKTAAKIAMQAIEGNLTAEAKKDPNWRHMTAARFLQFWDNRFVDMELKIAGAEKKYFENRDDTVSVGREQVSNNVVKFGRPAAQPG